MRGATAPRGISLLRRVPCGCAPRALLSLIAFSHPLAAQSSCRERALGALGARSRSSHISILHAGDGNSDPEPVSAPNLRADSTTRVFGPPHRRADSILTEPALAGDGRHREAGRRRGRLSLHEPEPVERCARRDLRVSASHGIISSAGLIPPFLPPPFCPRPRKGASILPANPGSPRSRLPLSHTQSQRERGRVGRD